MVVNQGVSVKTQSKFRKWSWRLLLVLLIALSSTRFVDQRAGAEYEQLFQRAFVTFALARTLNGVISVVQGTELALQPAGVGVTLTPGQVLDPVNDLVERFSWIMMGATISLGIQNVLLDVSAWWLVQVLVGILAVWLLLRSWFPDRDNGFEKILLPRVLMIVLFIRFAVPVMLIANDMLYQQFLEQRYQQSTEVIHRAGRELEQLQEQTTSGKVQKTDKSMLESITEAWTSTVETVDLSGRLDRMQAQAAEAIEHLVQLSVVFILQTALLPVAFLWIFLEALKRLFRFAHVKK